MDQNYYPFIARKNEMNISFDKDLEIFSDEEV